MPDSIAVVLLAGGEHPNAHNDFQAGETLLSCSMRAAAEAQRQLDPRRRATVVLSRTDLYEGPFTGDFEHVYESGPAGALPAVLDALRYYTRRGLALPTTIVTMCGDEPLITPKSIVDLVVAHGELNNHMTALAVDVQAAPESSHLRAISGTWGRLIQDDEGNLIRVDPDRRDFQSSKPLSSTDLDRITRQVLAGRYCALGIFALRMEMLVRLENLVPATTRDKRWIEELVRVAFEHDCKVDFRFLEDWREAVSVATAAQLTLAVVRHRELQPIAVCDR